MDNMNQNWLHDLFINEAKAAKDYHNRAGGGSASAIIDVTVLPSEDINDEALYRFMVDGEAKLYFHGTGEWTEVGKPASDGTFNPFKHRVEKYNSLAYAFYGKYGNDPRCDYSNENIDEYVAQCLDGIDLTNVENFSIRYMFDTNTNSLGSSGITYVPMVLRCGNHFKYAEYAMARTRITEFDDYFTAYDACYLFYECYLMNSAVYDARDTSGFDYMFYRCSNLTDCVVKNFGQGSPTLASGITRSSSAIYMFGDCYKLTNVSFENCGSSVTDYTGMFANCKDMVEPPTSLKTSHVKTLTEMFTGCTALKTTPAYDTSSATSVNSMFAKCTSLEEVRSMDLRSATYVSSMFNGCSSLVTIRALDMRSATNTSSMLSNCKSLTNVVLKNINTNLQVGSGTTYGHLLTVDSLVGLIYELRTQTSQKTLTVGTANLAKLTDVYVKLIDITDDMRAEDDLIDEKMPFVVCESTDEGAMLIGDYVLTKNWKLA